MSLQNDERTITILRIISEGKLGSEKTGLFAKLDDVIEEMGDKQATKQIIDGFLLPKKYIRIINDKFKSVTGNELDYKAYQITQLGKTFLSSKGISSAIQLSSLPPNDIDSKMKERLEALINEAQDVLKTHTPNPPGVIGFPTLDSGGFQKWAVSSENIIRALTGNSSYLNSFLKETKQGGYTGSVEAGRGVMIALKDDLESGIVSSQRPHRNSSEYSDYDISKATITSNVVSVQLNDAVFSHIKKYLENDDYFHAVEESYKVVREKLREITNKEKATDIFNMNAENRKYHEKIFGEVAEEDSPEEDFYRGVGYLNLSIQFLRNEKSHTLATTLDKNLALHYISLASLAYDLISGNEK